jgi:hypothetical protein
MRRRGRGSTALRRDIARVARIATRTTEDVEEGDGRRERT